MPRLEAYEAISNMSFLCRGSPPLIIKTGLQSSAIWSIKLSASWVVSWLGSGSFWAWARQWTQAKLHARVDSQAITLGAKALDFGDMSWRGHEVVFPKLALFLSVLGSMQGQVPICRCRWLRLGLGGCRCIFRGIGIGCIFL